MDFVSLKKNLRKDFTGFKKVKLAILGDSATQLLATAIRAYGYEEQLDIEVWESDYDNITQTVLSEDSQLYSFKPDYVLLFHSTPGVAKNFYKLDFGQKSIFADTQIDVYESYMDLINTRLKTNVFFVNFSEQNDGIFGNYANKVAASFPFQIRKLNYRLSELSQIRSNFHVFDLSYLQQGIMESEIIDPKFYISSSNVFALDFLPIFAKNTVAMILPFTGKFKKCLILDLDNTTWGGIIGDDGIDKIQIGDLGIGKAFTELQTWAKQLQERGIILCICSKNTEHLAKEPFEKHPDMVLRLEDISVFMANWESKVDNIKRIQEVLQIGFDSMVFLDDNPFERNLIREYLPAVSVPELPEDPVEYLSFLKRLNLFETISFTETDGNRTKKYQEEAKRATLLQSVTSESDFLHSLQMEAEVAAINNFSLPRVAQLILRSNQFNLRTIRHSEDDVKEIMNSQEWISLTFKLKDKFGEYGLIAVILMKQINDSELFIDTWIMSCRVLKRGMEHFSLNKIAEIAQQKAYKKLSGEYIPSPKNGIVENHYQDLGFVEKNGKWELELSNFVPKEVFIN